MKLLSVRFLTKSPLFSLKCKSAFIKMQECIFEFIACSVDESWCAFHSIACLTTSAFFLSFSSLRKSLWEILSERRSSESPSKGFHLRVLPDGARGSSLDSTASPPGTRIALLSLHEMPSCKESTLVRASFPSKRAPKGTPCRTRNVRSETVCDWQSLLSVLRMVSRQICTLSWTIWCLLRWQIWSGSESQIKNLNLNKIKLSLS